MTTRSVYPSRIAIAALCAALPFNALHAGTASGTLTVTVQPPPLVLTINPASANVACNAAPGATVATLSTSGGDGNPVSFASSEPSGEAAGEFVISGASVVVGSAGIAAADCGKTWALSITASQP
jgi:hypothetical protein